MKNIDFAYLQYLTIMHNSIRQYYGVVVAMVPSTVV